ncbi:MAG: hypothetical protein K6T35_05950, partial [Meiothermus silvanus]|nr:hypothetical protein [Allomeiothermus silvanus]
LPSFPPDKPLATRAASGKALDALAERIPWLLAGGADLTENTNTKISGALDHSAEHPEGRVLRFGVREHAMGAIANGMCAHGGVIPAVGTFMVFSDYLRPTLRLASMSRLGPIFVFTHDSVGLGEDGPTHQPIEHLPSLRAIPGLVVIRPCDANETSVAWRVALQRRDGPTVLALTRQPVPVLDRSRLAPAEELVRGAYVLSGSEGARPDVILIGTGSEVAIALEAQALLREDGIDARVVAADPPLGVSRWTSALLQAAAELAPQHEYLLYLDDRPLSEPVFLTPPFRPRPLPVGAVLASPLVWQQLYFPLAAWRDRVDVVVSPYYCGPLVSHAPQVVCLHDISFAQTQ